MKTKSLLSSVLKIDTNVLQINFGFVIMVLWRNECWWTKLLT